MFLSQYFVSPWLKSINIAVKSVLVLSALGLLQYCEIAQAQNEAIPIQDLDGNIYSLVGYKTWQLARPRDFYTLLLSENTEPCRKIFNDLNRPYTPDSIPLKSEASILLHSDLQFRFVPINFSLPMRLRPSVEGAIFDINNNGTLEAVYRETSNLSAVFFNSVFYVDGIVRFVDDTIEAVEYVDITGEKFKNSLSFLGLENNGSLRSYVMNSVRSTPRFQESFISSSSASGFYFNFVEFEGVTYVLFSSSSFRNSVVHTFVASIDSHTSGEIQCHLKGNYIAVSNQQYLSHRDR